METAPPGLDRSKLQRAALIFAVGSIAIMAVTVLVTTDDETWQGVLSFGAGLVALLFVAESLRMVLESLSLLTLVNGIQDEKITAIEALEVTIEGYFIGQLIPISAAGVPYQGFLLTRKGVRAGLATAIVLVKGFVPGVFFFFVLVGATTLTALGWEGPEGTATFLKVVGPLSAVPLVFTVAALVVMLRYPRRFDRMVDGVAAFLQRRLRGKISRKIEQYRIVMEEESHVFREALTTLGRHKRWILFWGILLVILAYTSEFMVAIVILRGFGYRDSMVGPLVLQCLLKPVLTATPTPGALAFGEGGYIGFFAAFLPARFVGVSLVLWRLAVYFVPMSAGGLLVAKRIGRRGFEAKTPQST
ncbi:MAG: flippase-like domain-containing protein [Candidatus Eisenbacteria bacterium]|nr:flippase-like domain-containing protein [Candidatus Eisenbacteria bacterium]